MRCEGWHTEKKGKRWNHDETVISLIKFNLLISYLCHLVIFDKSLVTTLGLKSVMGNQCVWDIPSASSVFEQPLWNSAKSKGSDVWFNSKMPLRQLCSDPSCQQVKLAAGYLLHSSLSSYPLRALRTTCVLKDCSREKGGDAFDSWRNCSKASWGIKYKKKKTLRRIAFFTGNRAVQHC